MLQVIPALAVMTIFSLPGLSTAQTQAPSLNTQDKITAIDDIKRGTMVTVQGKVQRILDTDEFRLADDSGDIVVYVGWQNFVPVNVEDRVTVRGFVDDDLFLEIYANQIIHADGRVTDIHHRR